MYVLVSVKLLIIRRGVVVVVCTDLVGKEPHSQVGMDKVVTSGREWSNTGPECGILYGGVVSVSDFFPKLDS